MPTSIIVVDDFFGNAKQLREAALKFNYPEGNGPFPGRNSVERIELEGLSQEVSRIVGEPLKPIIDGQAHGKTRISLASDVAKAKVHVDASHWSGILYLSDPKDCKGGTEFFRHKATDTDRAPYSDEEAMQKFGAPSAKKWTSDILDNESLDDSKWEMTMRVPMRFNRLVLLRPWMWHTAGEAFGDSIENGRLIYMMFFQSAR
ncbi:MULTISPECIES: DUF6445 family protein [Gammaproteobacteria]|uniref:DUF6445 family protein n=2 Tax=Gammaproteobacteria TaxID=1236 RepID=UPI000DCF766C|nr:hypothetical protein DQX04_04620 [Aliidiomarina sp. B3213]TCZ93405.1 hypothetical protein EYQ95_00675 [Lysobacter sp. N42]